MKKFQKGDTVKIVAGKDKGKEGVIEKVFPKKELVLIPGVNMYKKHVKGQAQRGGQSGGIYDIPRPLPYAKVMHVDPKTGKPTRVGFKTVKGSKIRIAKRSGQTIKATTKKNK